MGGGCALITTSAILASTKVAEDVGNSFASVFSGGEPIPENDYTAENILLITGMASMIASIPLFIASKKNKRRAMDMSANIKMENARMFQYQSFVQASYPAIALKIKL